MITVKIKGGLGNQLFQYAIGYILSNGNHQELTLDTTFFSPDNDVTKATVRNLELNHFNIPINIASKKLLRRIHNPSKTDKLLNLLNPIHKYTESDFTYHKEILDLGKNTYLTGYFQSYKYYIGKEQEIRNLFRMSEKKLSDSDKFTLGKILSGKSISVHIRRGDYINNPQTQAFHGSCSIEYYESAITFMLQQFSNPLLVFFSDDIEWVKHSFAKHSPYSLFIDNNDPQTSWKDLYLMSNCNHHIIANSTFSWWAAWLRDFNKKKIIIAPEHWYHPSRENSGAIDLIPNHWIRLPN